MSLEAPWDHESRASDFDHLESVLLETGPPKSQQISQFPRSASWRSRPLLDTLPF